MSAKHERIRIGSLLPLAGVGFPTASVILHFCHKDPYPIIDFRALWSLGYDKPPSYNIQFWQEYVDYTRKLAQQTGLSIGELDKALWQYSSERQ